MYLCTLATSVCIQNAIDAGSSCIVSQYLVLVVALMLDNGPGGAKAHVHGGKAIVE
jgi:hypothetical protein